MSWSEILSLLEKRATFPRLRQIADSYFAYVETFRAADGALGEMLQLKLDHTLRVVSNAALIAEGEGFSVEETEEALVCALLHDTGRYAQLREFGTFSDVKSVDHAEKGADVISSCGWLSAFPESVQSRWLSVIRFHNKMLLPDGLDDLTTLLAHAIRDADKLDIFYVLESSAKGALEDHPEIAWGLPVHADPSPRVVEAVQSGNSVHYKWIQSLSDFVLIELGWLHGGLFFPTSYSLAQERNVFDFLTGFLKRLTDSPLLDETFCAVKAAFVEKLKRER